MSEGYEKLQKIGIQKIYEDTHISRVHIQTVLGEEFNKLNRVQFLGFLSILEREYKVDLSELKAKGLAYFKNEEMEKETKTGVFVIAKKSKSFNMQYIFLILIVFIGVVIFNLDFSSKDNSIEVQSVENKIIQNVKQDIISAQIETNTMEVNSSTIDENLTKIELVAKIPVEEINKELEPFRIVPKSKVWVGYIDIKTNKRYSETTKNILNLKRDKEWLIILGHSNVKIEAGGEELSFNKKGQLRLLYRDSQVTKISLKEFKKLNRGRKW